MASADFLTRMTVASRDRARTARRQATEITARLVAAPPPLPLRVGQFEVVAEAKLASPSSGRIAPRGRDEETVVALARSYAEGGAAAVSVLTTPESFDGSLTHLEAVSGAVPVPVLRKDFLVDPIQVIEARAHGASGILLIARILSRDLLVQMVDTADELGMFSLVEVFDRADIEVASAVFDRNVLVGANTRDLTDLGVDPARLADLVDLIPAGLVRVAESGMERPDDARRAAELGYRAALVGTALVRSRQPAAAVAGFVEAGRGASMGVVS